MQGAQISSALTLAARLCRHFEGFRSRPYLCPAGVPTIGFGSTRHPDGSPVTLDDEPITQETAELWLIADLGRVYLPGVVRASPALLAAPAGVLAATADWAYNLGVARYRASTFRRRVDERDWHGAADELIRWNRAGGRVLPGLVRRRQAERDLFLSGVR